MVVRGARQPVQQRPDEHGLDAGRRGLSRPGHDLVRRTISPERIDGHPHTTLAGTGSRRAKPGFAAA